MVELTADFLSPWIGIDRTAETATARVPSQAELHQVQMPSAVMGTSPVGLDQLLPFMEFANAPWLPAVQQRIFASVPPAGYEVDQDGTWVSQKVATAAVQFLSKFPDAFPIEPYLYCASSGDLVAEFQGTNNKLTCLISPDFVTAYSYREGELTPKRLPHHLWSAEQMKLLIAP